MPDGAYYMSPHKLVAVDESHPDRTEPLTNIRHIFLEVISDEIGWRGANPATEDDLRSVHNRDYVRKLYDEYSGSPGRVNVDTRVDEAMLRAVRAAAGCAMAAASEAVSAESPTYSLTRPSWHHAQPDTADGYCLFNNLAIATETVLETTDVKRVAVVDWDVHHGNGTQEVFYGRDDVLVFNLHNHHGAWNEETHPQTGGATNKGRARGRVQRQRSVASRHR